MKSTILRRKDALRRAWRRRIGECAHCACFSTRPRSVPDCHRASSSRQFTICDQDSASRYWGVSRDSSLASQTRSCALCLRQTWGVEAATVPAASRRAAPYLPLLRPQFVIHVSEMYDSRMHRLGRQQIHAPPRRLTGQPLARLDPSRLQFLCIKPNVAPTCYRLRKLTRSRLVSPSCS